VSGRSLRFARLKCCLLCQHTKHANTGTVSKRELYEYCKVTKFSFSLSYLPAHIFGIIHTYLLARTLHDRHLPQLASIPAIVKENTGQGQSQRIHLCSSGKIGNTSHDTNLHLPVSFREERGQGQ